MATSNKMDNLGLNFDNSTEDEPYEIKTPTPTPTTNQEVQNVVEFKEEDPVMVDFPWFGFEASIESPFVRWVVKTCDQTTNFLSTHKVEACVAVGLVASASLCVIYKKELLEVSKSMFNSK